MPNALVIGSQGTIGSALIDRLQATHSVSQVSRENCDYSETALAMRASELSELGTFDLIICCVGFLHNDAVSPEKRLSELDEQKLLEYFRINAVIPALCIKAFVPLLKRPVKDTGCSKFIALSAMVGSIDDNRLGGWYGYRSSKAALNMLVKTAAIEVARSNKKAALVAMHPGTTVGPLSKPYSSKLSEDTYYTAEQSAERIIKVARSLDVGSNGTFLNWNGKKLDW